MSRAVVLMYHGLYVDDRELAEIDPSDRPYAISVQDFCHQLDALRGAGIEILHPSEPSRSTGPAVMLTFDDGHASNHRHAVPALRERGLSAIFFVTTDFIARRPGFCSWNDLGEMAASGMEIGSHGRTHRFFDSLDSREAEDELADSSRAIARATGCVPRRLSFPGGRYRAEQVEIAARQGIRQCFTSDPGSHAPEELATRPLIRRMPVRHRVPLAAFLAIARGDFAAHARARVAFAGKRAARAVLGNNLYHALYDRFSS